MTYHQFTVALEEIVKRKADQSLSVELHNTKKNNGIIRSGLAISGKGTNITPTIYLEEYYERYLSGWKMEEISDEILKLYEEVKLEGTIKIPEVFNYAKMKDKIIMRLVQKKENEELLKKIPSASFLDLAVTFYLALEITDDGMASIQVDAEMLKRWNVSIYEIFAVSMMNMQRLLPARFRTMQEVMEEAGMVLDKQVPMYVLSNDRKNYGAAAILYPGYLKKIGEYLKENYYVFPSSIHEVLIVPESGIMDKAILDEMVRSINEMCLDPEEILENHAYYYDRARERLEIR